MRGFRLDSASLLCVACDVSCETCVFSATCSQCASGYISLIGMRKPDDMTCVAC